MRSSVFFTTRICAPAWLSVARSSTWSATEMPWYAVEIAISASRISSVISATCATLRSVGKRSSFVPGPVPGGNQNALHAEGGRASEAGAYARFVPCLPPVRVAVPAFDPARGGRDP